jgi:hypothetical protein
MSRLLSNSLGVLINRSGLLVSYATASLGKTLTPEAALAAIPAQLLVSYLFRWATTQTSLLVDVDLIVVAARPHANNR